MNNAASRIYAVEGQCFVVAPCATVSKEMVQMLCGDDHQAAAAAARAAASPAIYAPDGQLMHEPLRRDAEGIVYADLDLGMISLAKAAADPAGHYARPDVTRLLLNKTPGDRVVPRAAPRRRSGTRRATTSLPLARRGAETPPSRRAPDGAGHGIRDPRSPARRPHAPAPRARRLRPAVPVVRRASRPRRDARS